MARQPHAIADVARPMAAVAPMPRLTAVDALRGAIMIVMALDHTRDFLHIGAMSFSPEDLSRTTAALFFTRWMTHICAPVFMFTAGLGAFFRLQRPGTTKADLSRFLWTRRWLVIVELTIMRLAMNFSLDARFPVILLVLSALGLSMICLAVLVHVPRHVLAIGSLAVVALHNLLDGVQASTFGALAPVSYLLHQQGVSILGGIPFVVAYPLVPWVAVMALGFSPAASSSARPKSGSASPALGNRPHRRLRRDSSVQRLRQSTAVVHAIVAPLYGDLICRATSNHRRSIFC